MGSDRHPAFATSDSSELFLAPMPADKEQGQVFQDTGIQSIHVAKEMIIAV